MSKDDWYRNKKWNNQIASEFEARLKRSRENSNKAQYLRIQASYLLNSRGTDTQQQGVQLMERLINEYPQETFSTVLGHEELGDHYLKTGNYTHAEEYFRIVTMHYHSTTRSGTSGLADLKQIEVILITDQQDKFQEAYELSTVKFFETDGSLELNDQKFYYANLLANLCLRMGKLDEASEYADTALQLSAIKEPQFPRHKGVGIINKERNILARLKKIREKALSAYTTINYTT